MEQVTARAKGGQVPILVFGGIMVQVRGGQHDTGELQVLEVSARRKANGLSQVIFPGVRVTRIQPTAIRQCVDEMPVRAVAAFTAALGTIKANAMGDIGPVGWVEAAEVVADGH